MKNYKLSFTWLYYRSSLCVEVDDNGIIVQGPNDMIGTNYKAFKDKIIECGYGRIDNEEICEH